MTSLSHPIRFGSNSALASPAYDDLYLPVYGGEVLVRFNEYLGVSGRLMRRNIPTGNTATFPRLGGIGAERHAVGSKLLGLDAEQTEISITLDERPLVSHFRLDDIDRAMSHFETRSEYAQQAAQALAEAQDGYSYRLLINCSRETPTSIYGGSASNFPGGGIDGAGTALDLDMQDSVTSRPTDDQIGNFLDGLDQIVERWDELRVPFDQRNVDINVKMWHGTRQFGSPRSASDLNNGRTPVFMANDGTYGSQANPGQFVPQIMAFNVPLQYNGFNIWRSNLLPNGQDLSSDDEPKYQGNFTNTRGIAYQMRAAGVAVKMDIMTEADRDVSRQDWLFVTKMLSGGGSLRPECAVELIDSGS